MVTVPVVISVLVDIASPRKVAAIINIFPLVISIRTNIFLQHLIDHSAQIGRENIYPIRCQLYQVLSIIILIGNACSAKVP